MVRTLDLRSIGREFESRPLRYRVRNPGQVVNTHPPLSPSSIIWYQPMWAVMPCDWEGNRRSGVALATRHGH